MFYSHEILQNPQYGVSTIWLAATTGPSSAAGRKLTRQAIEQVNLRKACEKIVEPGVPFALRLQGNLLYGVSRVYDHQARYVLLDVEKVQASMRMYSRWGAVQTTDPKAGKTSRSTLLIGDDPAFDAAKSFADFKFNASIDFEKMLSQATAQTSSRMSPHTMASYSSDRRDSVSFDLGGSDGGSFQVPSPFGQVHVPSSAQKSQRPNPVDDPFADELQHLDLGIEFNAEGEEVAPGTRVARLPPDEFDPMDLDMEYRIPTAAAPMHLPDDVFGVVNNMPPALVAHDPFADELLGEPQPREQEEQQLEQADQVEQASGNAAPTSRGRGRPKLQRAGAANPFLDVGGTNIDRAEYNRWMRDYVGQMQAQSAANRPRVTPAQARKNAHNMIFTTGVFGIGGEIGAYGFAHPLLEAFAGDALERMIYHWSSDEASEPHTPERSRRRSAEEAFGSDDGDNRRVRAKLGQGGYEEEMGRPGPHMDPRQADPFADELTMELGRDDPMRADDRLSSSAMPWHRHSSVGPGSALRSIHGSAQKPSARILSSPMPAQLLDFADRFNDSAGQGFSDSINAPELDMSSLSPHGMAVLASATAEISQGALAAGLDTSSEDFLGFVRDHAEEAGVACPKDSVARRRWVAFGDMFSPAVQTPAVAAHAFYHVLTLATKGLVAVFQEGAAEEEPFGEIRVGVVV